MADTHFEPDGLPKYVTTPHVLDPYYDVVLGRNGHSGPLFLECLRSRVREYVALGTDSKSVKTLTVNLLTEELQHRGCRFVEVIPVPENSDRVSDDAPWTNHLVRAINNEKKIRDYIVRRLGEECKRQLQRCVRVTPYDNSQDSDMESTSESVVPPHLSEQLSLSGISVLFDDESACRTSANAATDEVLQDDSASADRFLALVASPPPTREVPPSSPAPSLGGYLASPSSPTPRARNWNTDDRPSPAKAARVDLFNGRVAGLPEPLEARVESALSRCEKVSAAVHQADLKSHEIAKKYQSVALQNSVTLRKLTRYMTVDRETSSLPSSPRAVSFLLEAGRRPSEATRQNSQRPKQEHRTDSAPTRLDSSPQSTDLSSTKIVEV
jgi:hypothetical protein